MPAARPETIVMREARRAARDEGLCVTIELSETGVVTRITMQPRPVDPPKDDVQRSDSGKPARKPGRWK